MAEEVITGAKHQNCVPLEAKEVNSVKCKHLVKKPGIHIEQLACTHYWKTKRMDGFIWTTCDTTVFTQSFTFQHQRTQGKHNRQRKDFSYTYFKGERE